MPPHRPTEYSRAERKPRVVREHEPLAFESDLERHRASADDVYGSHGVQPDPAESAFQPAGRSNRGLTRVGERRRR